MDLVVPIFCECVSIVDGDDQFRMLIAVMMTHPFFHDFFWLICLCSSVFLLFMLLPNRLRIRKNLCGVFDKHFGEKVDVETTTQQQQNATIRSLA